MTKIDLRCNNGIHSKKRSTTESFIDKAIKLHGDTYNYLKVLYLNSTSKINIICKKHGEFYQTPNSHLCGSGCPKCGLSKNTKNRSSTLEQFRERVYSVHGNKYDYSNVLYTNAHDKIIVICSVHGEFKVDPNNFLRGHGCGKCYYEKNKAQNFIEKFKEIHGDIYEYSKVSYINNNTKVCITCKKHGDFWQLPRIHYSGHGCPTCNSSKGEQLIGYWLDRHNIRYVRGYTFSDLRGYKNKHLRFDFFLPDFCIFIEFDGQQHYSPVRFNGMSEKLAIDKYKRTRECDLLKDRYLKEKCIFLLRISYKVINSIDTILEKSLSNNLVSFNSLG